MGSNSLGWAAELMDFPRPLDLQPKDSPQERAQILSGQVSEHLFDPAWAQAPLREYLLRDWAKE